MLLGKMGGQFNVHELGQTAGDGEGQRGPACCSPWGCKESDTTEQQQIQALVPGSPLEGTQASMPTLFLY